MPARVGVIFMSLGERKVYMTLQANITAEIVSGKRKAVLGERICTEGDKKYHKVSAAIG